MATIVCATRQQKHALVFMYRLQKKGRAMSFDHRRLRDTKLRKRINHIRVREIVREGKKDSLSSISFSSVISGGNEIITHVLFT